MITVENKNVNIIVEDNNLNIEIEKKVFVTVDGGRGPQGLDGLSSTSKIYEGYISQIGTNAPTTLVLTDTLGLNNIVFDYEGDGTYVSYSNVYNALKTSFFIDRPSSAFDETRISLISSDILQITTKRNYIQFQSGFITNGFVDNILSNTLIRIVIHD